MLKIGEILPVWVFLCWCLRGATCSYIKNSRMWPVAPEGKVLILSEDQGGEGAASAGAEGKPTWERHRRNWWAIGNKVSEAIRGWDRWAESWSVTREVPLWTSELRMEESPLKNSPGSYPDKLMLHQDTDFFLVTLKKGGYGWRLRWKRFCWYGNCQSPFQSSSTVKDPTASGSDGVR